MEDSQTLDELLTHPVTASMFAYIKQENRPVGVREVQKALSLSNPSTAYWHLNKLLNNGILIHLQGNKYQLKDEYLKVRKVPLSVVQDYYFFGGVLIPSLFLVTVFLVLVTIATLSLIVIQWWEAAAFTGLFSLVTLTVLIVRSYFALTKPVARKK